MSATPSTWAAEVLWAQRMPPAEIDAVLGADTAEQVRQRLELHAERLRERLFDELCTLERVEHVLTADLGAAREPRTLSSAASR